jgi:hypothetical protein
MQPRSAASLILSLVATFQRAIAADPDSPAGYRLLAATAWTVLLFEQGAISVDDFLGEARKDYRRSPPRGSVSSQPTAW